MPKKNNRKKVKEEKLSIKEVTGILKEIKEILERKKDGYLFFGQVKDTSKGADIKGGCVIVNTSQRIMINSILNSLELKPEDIFLMSLGAKINSKDRKL